VIGVQSTGPEHAARDEPGPAEEEQHGADDIAEYHQAQTGLRPPEADGGERVDFREVGNGGNGELCIGSVRVVSAFESS